MTDSQRIRYAIVGAGTITRNHLAALGKLSDRAEVAAIADLREDAAKQYAADHNIARAYTDHRKMLADERPDVVLVCVPPIAHAPIVRDALEHDCHVYSEKPFVATIKQANELLELAQQRGRIVTANHQRRCTPRYQLIHKLLGEGRIGKLHRASLYCSFRFRSLAYYRQDWKGRAQWAGGCGGVVLNQCIHELDILLWALRRPVSVTGFCRTLNSEIEVEDDAYAIFDFGDGAAGMMHASVTDVPGRNLFEFVGDKGTLEVTPDEIRLTTLDPSIPKFHATWQKQYGKPTPTTECVEEPSLGEGVSEFDLMHENLLDVLSAGKDPSQLVVPPADTTLALEVTNAIYLSSAERRPVDLPLDADRYEKWFAGKIK